MKVYDTMNNLTDEAKAIMLERFGNDCIISLSTAVDNIPYVRNVNSFYKDGAFYVLTYGKSNKMKQININPNVAVAGFWFQALGTGVNLGYFGKPENREIASIMNEKFAEWINNGHNNFDDENTCILKIELNRGILLSNGRRFDISFK